MLKIFLLIIPMIISSIVCDCNRNKTCSLTNNQCSGTFGGGKCDPSNNCCPMYNYCLNKTCFASTNTLYCASDIDCYPDQLGTRLYKCSKGNKCISVFNRGDKCSGSESCYGEMKCDGSNTCVGNAPGTTCVEAVYNYFVKAYVGFSCQYGYYCNSSKLCAPFLTDKDVCYSNAQCNDGFLCNTKTSKCVKSFSLDTGTPCDQEDLCNENNVCLDGKCVAGDFRKVPTICQSDATCSQGESCGPCNDFTGRRYCNTTYHSPSTDCRKEIKDALACYLENKCTTYYSFEVGSCQHDNCLSYMQSVWYCKMCIPNQDELGDCYGRYDVAGRCLIALPLYIVAIIVGGLTIVLSLLFLVFIKIGDSCNSEDRYNPIN